MLRSGSLLDGNGRPKSCRGFCAVGFFCRFWGHNLNISHLISDVFPPLWQMVMPSSAGKSAQQPEPKQKQVSLDQECDILSFTRVCPVSGTLSRSSYGSGKG